MNRPHPYRRAGFIGAIIVTALVLGALLWWAINRVSPLPPKHLVMSTGAAGGAYQQLALQYQSVLAEEGITLELRPSEGDLENLARLRDPQSGVDFAFVQGGLTNQIDSPDLASLGTMFYQPLWVFYRGRGKTPAGLLSDLRGLRISMGPPLSGSRALATRLLARAGVDTSGALALGLTPDDAATELMAGRIDAVVMLTAWEAPAVQELLMAPGISLLPLKRVDAFVALYPFLSKVVLPEGTGDMVSNNPPTDVNLLADRSSLVIRKRMHPALQYLLLNSAEEIHSPPGIFAKAGQFPADEAIDLPISRHASQFYKSGRPFLQRYMPFWLAAIVERLAIVLVPLVGLMVPLVRMAPAVYAWRIRRRVLGLYTELRSLEREVDERGGGEVPAELSERLERLEQRAHAVKMPVAYTPMLYTLRDHIALVRKQLEGE